VDEIVGRVNISEGFLKAVLIAQIPIDNLGSGTNPRIEIGWVPNQTAYLLTP